MKSKLLMIQIIVTNEGTSYDDGAGIFYYTGLVTYDYWWSLL